MKAKNLLYWIIPPCKNCPYKLGQIHTPVNPCPQCRINSYDAYERFKNRLKNGDKDERMEEARDCLFLADEYMANLAVYADRAANTRLYDADIKAIVEELFPISDSSSNREKTTTEKCRSEFMVCYYAPDIKKFRGTAWGVINAASDLVTHSMPHKNTKNYAANNWGRIMDGHAIMDKAVKLCMAAA